MFTIILRKDLYGDILDVHYLFGSDGLVTTFNADKDGLRPNTVLTMQYKTAWALIHWHCNEANYKLHLDSRYATEEAYYAAMDAAQDHDCAEHRYGPDFDLDDLPF